MRSAFFGSDYGGRVIDERFTLLRWLGGTERSSVFLTECEVNPVQKAAIKLVSAASVDGDACIAQWEMARNLSHPHIVRLLYAGRCEVDGEDLLYVVTELAEEVLCEVLWERPLTSMETRELLGPVLDALAYLHERGLMHGHLKPSNILVVDDRLKLSVDGIHRVGEPGGLPSQPGTCDPPEATKMKAYPAADVWSVGALLVEALMQQPPVWEDSSGEGPVVPVSIPQPFFSIVRECLRIDPASRCTLADIKARLAPAPVAEFSAKPAESATKGMREAPRKRGKMIFGGAVLVLLVVIAGLEFGRNHTSPSPQAAPQKSSPAPAAAPPESPVSAARSPEGSIVKGAVTHREMPQVPQSASDTIRGHVQVGIRVQVDANGNVSSATIDSPGPSRYFAKLALAAAQDWRFEPAQVGGRPVASTWILQFRFEPTGTEVIPVESSP